VRSTGLLAMVFVASAGILLPSATPRAETADSIMESRKTAPRHKEVKKLGVHHTSVCRSSRQCRGNHTVWFCSRSGDRCFCRPTGRRC
jgi:hypothetical protein